MQLRGIMDYSYFATLHATFPNIKTQISVRITHRRRSKMKQRQKRTEGEVGMGRKGVLVSHICREPAALCLDFLSF